MLCYDYGASSLQDGLVVVRSEPSELVETMHVTACMSRLLVWRRAIDNAVIRDALSKPNWPIRLVSAMELSDDWPWQVEKSPDGATYEQSEILGALSSAAGIHGPPSGNLLLTIKFREFDDRTSDVGGVEWWKARQGRIRGADEFPASLVQQIIAVLEQLRNLGSQIFVEQISIVLNKDPDEPLCSITPTLHADVYAGKWGAAVSSLLEADLNPSGGVLFLPTCIMSELDHMRPIRLGKLHAELDAVPMLATATGDLFIFDGMMDENGMPVRTNGVPHISSDIPGKSARLALLMCQVIDQ